MSQPRNFFEKSWSFLCRRKMNPNKTFLNEVKKMRTNTLILSMMLCCMGIGVTAQNTQFKFSGKVIDKSGKGIAGVVVNDGVHFTKTDRQGTWNLASDTTMSKFVSISTPASHG